MAKTGRPKPIGKMMKTIGQIKPVLILTQQDDGHADALIAELEALHTPWVRFDPASFPQQASLRARLDDTGWRSVFTIDEIPIVLENIGSVWYRRPGRYAANPSLPTIEQDFIIQEARYGLGGLLRGITGLWVNHPEDNHLASYKPLQLQVARDCGLAVPRTLITNEPDEFLRFYKECQGEVVYKLLGAPIFWDKDIPISTYTQRVPADMLQHAHRIKATAHLFQQYVEKQFELRITIIGDEVFAAEIYAQHSDLARVDWRRQYADLRYGVHNLPAAIRTSLIALMRSFRLQYGAIDMIVTPEGEYVFLELNPNGQCGWIEQATGMPLFRTLALLLTGNNQ
jgi:ATP-grasp ribosomal peptide maturase